VNLPDPKSQPPAAPQAPSLLTEIGDWTEKEVSGLETLAHRLHALADRVLGTEPEQDAEKPTQGLAVGVHQIGRVVGAHNMLTSVRQRLATAVDRLEAL